MKRSAICGMAGMIGVAIACWWFDAHPAFLVGIVLGMIVNYADTLALLEKAAAEACQRCQLIDQLREPEGHQVTLCSDNAGFNGLPNCAIVVSAAHTDWDEVYYRADTVGACLQLARDDMVKSDA